MAFFNEALRALNPKTCFRKLLRIYIRRFFSKHFVLCCVASVSVALYFDPFFDPPELEVIVMHLCAHVEATSFKRGQP